MKKSSSRKNKEWRRRKARNRILLRNRDVNGNMVHAKYIKPLTKVERKVMYERCEKVKGLFDFRSVLQRKKAIESLDRELKFINVKEQLR